MYMYKLLHSCTWLVFINCVAFDSDAIYCPGVFNSKAVCVCACVCVCVCDRDLVVATA